MNNTLQSKYNDATKSEFDIDKPINSRGHFVIEVFPTF